MDKFLLLANVAETTKKVVEDIDPDATYTAAVVLTCFSVVFLALIILIIVMKIMGIFFKGEGAGGSGGANKGTTGSANKGGGSVKETAVKETKPVVQKAVTQAPEKSVAVNTPQAVQIQSNDESEIVAVIAAAIACIYENTDTAYTITSIRPVKQRNQWALAGLYNNTNPF
ncbi:MAG: OadG family protein [Oscillospiraceae bacterium]|nr:OadG family protein [Oscillospiraceae bacterium]